MTHPQIRYAALLRGINVGGHKTVSMATVKILFEQLQFQNVKTLLNSGNILFDTDQTDVKQLSINIETELGKAFGYPIRVLLRTTHELQTLIDADPFAGIAVTPETRLYVTFRCELGEGKNALKIPYHTPENDFQILRVTDREIISVVTITPTKNTSDVMGVLEKEYGKNVTTRNWNTVRKLVG